MGDFAVASAHFCVGGERESGSSDARATLRLVQPPNRRVVGMVKWLGFASQGVCVYGA